eukprot:4293376-Prorocentrum_lima.AAC.1
MEIAHLLGPSSLDGIEDILDGPRVQLVPVQAALMMVVVGVEKPCHSTAVLAEPGVEPLPCLLYTSDAADDM